MRHLGSDDVLSRCQLLRFLFLVERVSCIAPPIPNQNAFVNRVYKQTNAAASAGTPECLMPPRWCPVRCWHPVTRQVLGDIARRTLVGIFFENPFDDLRLGGIDLPLAGFAWDQPVAVGEVAHDAALGRLARVMPPHAECGVLPGHG